MTAVKVLHYVNENRLTWGESYIQLLAELSRLGVTNSAVCKSGGTLASRLREEGIPFYTCDIPIAVLPVLGRNFAKIAERVAPDIIHTRLSSAALIGGYWGKRMGIPTVETLDKHARIKYYRDASLLLPCSRSVAKGMAAQGFPEEKMRIIPNAIDVMRYQCDLKEREQKRAELGAERDTLIIASAGRFDDGKGFKYLIEAFSLLHKSDLCTKKTKLLLLGDGPHKEQYRALITQYGLAAEVIMPGFVQDVRPWLWASDIFVFPSDKPDAFGIALLEAAACGLASIATDVGGPSDIIDDGRSGIIVPPGSAEAISGALLRLINDGDLLKSTARESLNRAHDFSVQKIALETVSCYESLRAHE